MTTWSDTYFQDIDAVLEFDSAAMATIQLKQGKDWKLLGQHEIQADEQTPQGIARKTKIVYVVGHSDPSRVPPAPERRGFGSAPNLKECYVCKERGKPGTMIAFRKEGEKDGKPIWAKMNPDGSPHKEPEAPKK
ncbi:MAG: hypothetical protein KGI38_11355 [Thaumarchaeota archaeon]|nr:hypothetical protein [Nitrososphaerota archaeon]